MNIPKFDVFISHSHNDKDKAIKFAEYLYNEYEAVPFIDNFVWGHADDLLKKIDNEYCKNEDGRYYNYSKRNFSTSHVHSMLSMAILEMIASCKSFIFIESDESVDYNQLKQSGTKTLSPWLYQELRYVRMLSSAMRPDLLLENHTFSAGGTLLISYDADLRDFNRITLRGLYQGDYTFT